MSFLFKRIFKRFTDAEPVVLETATPFVHLSSADPAGGQNES